MPSACNRGSIWEPLQPFPESTYYLFYYIVYYSLILGIFLIRYPPTPAILHRDNRIWNIPEVVRVSAHSGNFPLTLETSHHSVTAASIVSPKNFDS